jgi:hypothetical protein
MKEADFTFAHGAEIISRDRHHTTDFSEIFTLIPLNL